MYWIVALKDSWFEVRARRSSLLSGFRMNVADGLEALASW